MTLTGWRKVVSKFFIIPQRYVLAIMGMLATANAYTMRVCLNLAITQMATSQSLGSEPHYDPDACLADDVSTSSVGNSTTTSTEYDFYWSEATQGLMLSAFYYGYVLTHLPGGMLAERYGGKWVLGLGLMSTAICTVLTPVIVQWGGAVALFVLRFIEGMGEGPTMPALMSLISRWIPPGERGRVGAIVFGGAQIGNIAGSVLSGIMLSKGHWSIVFYFFGGIGFLWCALFFVLCYNNPNYHPYITLKEKEYLNKTVESSALNGKLDPVPWKALLRSVALWSLIIAGIGHDWVYFTMVTDLPKYMTDVLKFNISQTGYLTTLPYVAMWIASFFFGILSDFCIKRKYHSVTFGRKAYTTIAATGPAVCIILASYSGCDRLYSVGAFILAMTLMGAYYSGMKVNALDITPNYAGTTTALVNGIAAISGIIVPYLVGLLTPDQTLKQWRIAFWICLAVVVMSNIVYIIWAKGDQEWWDDVDKHGYPVNWKHGVFPARKHKNEKTDTKKEKV